MTVLLINSWCKQHANIDNAKRVKEGERRHRFFCFKEILKDT